jgi:uncharacterized protein (DUF4415 family)
MKPDATSDLFDETFIAAAIAAAPETPVFDPENPPTRPEDWKNGFVSHSYAELKAQLATRRRRGPGKAPKKTPTTIRFDPDVLAALKATGRGWQTRVNDTMREWLKAHSA